MKIFGKKDNATLSALETEVVAVVTTSLIVGINQMPRNMSGIVAERISEREIKFSYRNEGIVLEFFLHNWMGIWQTNSDKPHTISIGRSVKVPLRFQYGSWESPEATKAHSVYALKPHAIIEFMIDEGKIYHHPLHTAKAKLLKRKIFD